MPADAPAPGGSVLFALGLAGVCAFVNFYATQPLLPLFAKSFGATKAQAALTVSAPPIAVALCSPFVGTLAGRLGRRRVIVVSLFLLSLPTALAATSGSIGALVTWRFLQGAVVPGIYAVSIGYVGEAWHGRNVGVALSALVSSNVVGGFLGRMLAALAADRFGWRGAFIALGALTLGGALVVLRLLPEAAHPGPPPAPPASLGSRVAALLAPRLLATYAVGFNVLFTLVATFTYVTFHLADPPYSLGPVALSSVFVVYLVGAVVTPLAGRSIDRVGSRLTLVVAASCGVAGAALTLTPRLWAVTAGLAVLCSAAFVSQSASTSYLHRTVGRAIHPTASGIYVSSYYLGGSAGGVLPALAWRAGGWPACVALVALVELVTIGLALRYWARVGEARGGNGTSAEPAG
ncbi:MAG TPA: MFS transporter [Anaeromyxobacteraceae bacterium]|nr:MFS transporter [Anaeromyxobacteraceae bacterium]